MRLFIRGNTEKLSDAELLKQYRETGDKFFVGELFKRYSHLVFGVCLSYFKDKDESKDAVMHIFEKLFEGLRRNEVQHFPAWLSFVSRNFCISELRKKKVRSAREEEMTYETKLDLMEEPMPETEVQAGQVEAALKTLKDDQRICVELFFLKGKSYKEISEVTGFSDKEVKSFIQNGKRNLKISLSTIHHEQIPLA
jgi:RNA polymerase sigma factor (sigma-70 family)